MGEKTVIYEDEEVSIAFSTTFDGRKGAMEVFHYGKKMKDMYNNTYIATVEDVSFKIWAAERAMLNFRLQVAACKSEGEENEQK